MTVVSHQSLGRKVTLYICIFSPFYGEDFYFEIPRPFQYLSFYVYAKSVFRDLPVGECSECDTAASILTGGDYIQPDTGCVSVCLSYASREGGDPEGGPV